MSWRPDWTDINSYPRAEASVLQFAWEFLRRSDEYDRFFHESDLPSGKGEPVTNHRFQEKWERLWNRFEILKPHDPAEDYSEQIGLDLLSMAVPTVSIYEPIEEKNDGESNALSATKLGEVVFRFNVLRPLPPQFKWAQDQAGAISKYIRNWKPPEPDAIRSIADDDSEQEVQYISERDFQLLNETLAGATNIKDYIVYEEAEDIRKYKSSDHVECLRLLDGRSQGASFEEIAAKLDKCGPQQRKMKTSMKDDALSTWRKKHGKAEDWCTRDYKLLVTEELGKGHHLGSIIREKRLLMRKVYSKQLPLLQEQLSDPTDVT